MAKKIAFNKKQRKNFEEKIKEALAKKNIGTPKLPPAIPARKTAVRQSAGQRYPKPATIRVERATSNKIFITGGIGDVLTLESFFSDQQRAALETIYYATSKHVPIANIFKHLPNYPKLTNHIVVWDDFSSFWAFCSKDEYLSRCRQFHKEINQGVMSSGDFSIAAKFSTLDVYNKSSVLEFPIAKIERFALPAQYFVLCPYSTDKRLKVRDFDAEDWLNTLKLLQDRGLQGVIINAGKDIIPENKSIINLNNKTTILESIEILKKSQGYIGVDSCLSVLAAKLFAYPNLLVKSVNEHLYRWKHLYYAPSTDFQFLVKNVKA